MKTDFSIFQKTEISEQAIAEGFKIVYDWLELPEPAVYKLSNPGELNQLSLELSKNPHAEIINDITINPGKDIGDRFSRFVLRELAIPASLNFSDHKLQRAEVLPYERFFNHLESQLKGQLGKSYHPAQHPCYRDLPWLRFFKDKANSSSELKTKLSQLENLVAHGVFHCRLYENLVLYCPFPKLLSVNDEGLLHSEESPAATWDEGFKMYYWNGVEVSGKLIEAPGQITATDVMRETNAERRRCMQEKLGSEAFASLLNLKEIDRDIDLKGNQQKLYRTTEEDVVAGEYIQYAQVVCPTTGRNYFLCVPPDIRNVWDAVAWTFGKSSENYNPQIEV